MGSLRQYPLSRPTYSRVMTITVRSTIIATVVASTSIVAASGASGSATARSSAVWQIQTSANPAATQISGLSSISCLATTDCVAVGSSSKTLSTTTRNLAEKWDGTQWKLQTMPTASGTSDTLYGVSCATSSSCLAVGSAYVLSTHRTVTLALAGSGASWQIVSSPTQRTRTQLNAVSCTAATWCEAVGFYDIAGGRSLAVAESWNGTTWHVQSPVHPLNGSQFSGVSCTSAHSCVAVGSVTGARTRPLAERWDGTRWRQTTVPLPTGASAGYFSAVSCTTTSACTATGTKFAPGGVTLAERWNGAVWTAQSTPNPSNWRGSFRSVELDGVACPTTSLCTASGEYAPGGSADYFVAEWNGTTWHLQSVPRPTDYQHGALLAISCVPTDCYAVGAYTGAATLQSTLAAAN